MSEELPTYQELIGPLFRVLADHPNGIATSEAYEEVADRVGLTEAQRDEPLSSRPQPIYENRIGWAHDRLKRAGLSHSKDYGVWQLTDEGTRLAEAHPDGLPPEALEQIAKSSRSDFHLTEHLADGGEATEAAKSDPDRREPENFTAAEAAKVVLAEADEPLNLIETESQNPAGTMYSSVIQETERRKERGDQPRFEFPGDGDVALTRWNQTGLTAYIEAHNDRIRRKLRERLQQMDPKDFEGLVEQLLVALGFQDVSVTSYSNDGGIDVRGTLVVGEVIRTQMAVQVKKQQANVRRPIVQQVRGSLGSHEQGLIITTSDFSSGAYEEAKRSDAVPVALMNGEQLVKLLVEHDILVDKESLSLLRLG